MQAKIDHVCMEIRMASIKMKFCCGRLKHDRKQKVMYRHVKAYK